MKPDLMPTVFQFWHTNSLPGQVAAVMRSVPRVNPELPHLVFDATRAESFIAERFGRRELDAFRACAVPSMQADYFRYCAVLACGGTYLDADLECRAPLRSLLGRVEDGIVFQRHNEMRTRLWPHPYPALVNGVFFFRRPGHPLLRLALEVATANIRCRVAENVWAVTGPGVFTSLYLLHTCGSRKEFLRVCRGDWVELTAPVVCDVVGDPARASAAFAGVAIEPAERLEPHLRVVKPLPLSASEDHWFERRPTIFC